MDVRFLAGRYGWVVVVVGLGLFILFGFSGSSSVVSGELVSSGCVGVDRSSYGVHPGVFGLLPSPSSCLVSFRDGFSSGVFPAESLSTSVYLQPDFYPSFVSDGLAFWKSPSVTHYGAVGLSAYPFSRSISLFPGESRTVRFFLHSGFGVRSFQEGRLAVDDSAVGGVVSVSLDDDSLRSIVLEPTFPQFYPGWVHPIDVVVSVSPDAVPGSYSVALVTLPVRPNDQSFVPREGEYYYSFVDFVGSRAVAQLGVSVLG